MKSYNLLGYSTIALHLVMAAVFAPPGWGPGPGVAFGFAYLVYALWINMIQNYWTHDRRFGTRRYDEARDNAMNIHDWLPVTASFSASLQNNHHHHSSFVRLSHDPGEYDFGFLTVRVMKSLGLVRPTASGLQKPADVPLREIGL
jgi:fatty-acid desaturase